MRYCIIILLLVTAFHSKAQVLKGTVVDELSGRPLSAATVVNLRTNMATYTDDDGVYAISVKAGDTVQFSFIGYRSRRRIAPPSLGAAMARVSLMPVDMQLPAYIVRPGLTKYQEDSLEMQALYGEELTKAGQSPVSMEFNNNIQFSGLISALARSISKSHKQEKHFMKTFQTFEANRFIDTRYTQELVHELTGLTGDTLVTFMNSYPMAYDYARTASDLEIKMWIRYNYKQYLHQKKEVPQTSRSAQ